MYKEAEIEVGEVEGRGTEEADGYVSVGLCYSICVDLTIFMLFEAGGRKLKGWEEAASYVFVCLCYMGEHTRPYAAQCNQGCVCGLFDLLVLATGLWMSQATLQPLML